MLILQAAHGATVQHETTLQSVRFPMCIFGRTHQAALLGLLAAWQQALLCSPAAWRQFAP